VSNFIKIDFLNCKIEISRKVFIPRIETEFWVEKAIKEVRSLKLEVRGLKILDVFAGSGCIGIAILKACPELCRRVDFVEIDERAIEQIEINLKLNKISPKRYRVYKSDLFEKLKGEKSAPYSGAGYDVIFANPPYVAEERIAEVEESVLKEEPKIALFAGKDGLFYIEKFLKEAKNFLKKTGVIYLEFDPKQKEAIKNIIKREGYSSFQFRKDQFKKYRWAKINK